MSISVDPIDRPVDYELGHSEREFQRLDQQAQIVGPFTRQVFPEAGIGSGMRVLNVGSGNGHVAVIAADLVGPAGEVIGTDRARAAVTAGAGADDDQRVTPGVISRGRPRRDDVRTAVRRDHRALRTNVSG